MLDPTATRRAPTWLLATVVVALYPWSWLVNQWFAANRYYEPLLNASGGLLYPNLQVCLPTILVWLAIFRLAGLRLADIGWRSGDLLPGLLAAVSVWLACHAVALVANGGTFALDPSIDREPRLAAGRLLGQLFGNALYEETMYRGFCLVQVLLVLLARGFSPTRAAWSAALASAVVFALPHVPNRIFKAAYAGPLDVLGDQAMLICSGLFLAWVYMRTRNLWWVVGLHALANQPTLIVAWPNAEADGSAKAVVSVFGLVLTIAWPWLFRRTARGS